MILGTTRELRGPNIWSQLTVLEVEIDLSAHLQRPAQDIDAIRFRANLFLPGVMARSSDDSDEISSHVPHAMKLAELLARTLIELQQQAGC